ncbi:MAG: GyrI-like domain-containing protein [Gammaproteobacteria bacterium]|nr:GyrI-like domain-containing protein [Gammaproteobacteria bacterium]
MVNIIILLLVVIAALFVYLACLPGDYKVSRSITVNTDIQSVFDKIRDFKTWPAWSPWLMHEPKTRLEFSENYTEEGGYYAWDGEYVGAGKLTHVQFHAPEQIKQRLEFTRPFKSVCDVSFDLKPQENGTAITWVMHGSMPFLFRFMTKKTVQMIGKDYELGLAMLAGQLAPQAEHPRISFDGEQSLSAQPALCQSFSGYLADMQTAMKEAYPGMMDYINQRNGKLSGPPLTVYHQVNLKTMHFTCDFAVPVEQSIDPGQYQFKQLPAGEFYKVSLKGDYRFLEMAWYSAYNHLRMLKIKFHTKRPSLEVYINNPSAAESTNQLVTELYVPLK